MFRVDDLGFGACCDCVGRVQALGLGGEEGIERNTGILFCKCKL